MDLNSASQEIFLPEVKKILVADDNPVMRNLLNTALSQWGYLITEAKDGEDAWHQLQLPDAPRILILDWLMPKLDGIELCKRIRKRLNFYPYIIFLTQVTGNLNIIHGIEAGADEFLLKPVNFAELKASVYIGEKTVEYKQIIKNQQQELHDYTSLINSILTFFTLKLKNTNAK